MSVHARHSALALSMGAGIAICTAAGCSSPPGATDGGADMLVDAGADAYVDAAIIPRPHRTLTTRPLLGTAVDDLLLDSFVTADTSWGHFHPVIPSLVPSRTSANCKPLVREILSAGPVGVAAPVVSLSPAALGDCSVILAPVVGSTTPVSAQLWVSLSDATGQPLPIPVAADGGAGDLDGTLTAGLLPNTLPHAAPADAYPLDGNAPPATIAGRQWQLLSLAAPVDLTQGGWFAITVIDPTATLYIAAPEVAPGAVPHPSHARGERNRRRAVTVAERAAIGNYDQPVPSPKKPLRREIRSQ